MAHNTDPGWIEQQAELERGFEGPDVRQALYDCMVMLKESHDYRIHKTKKQLEEEQQNG